MPDLEGCCWGYEDCDCGDAGACGDCHDCHCMQASCSECSEVYTILEFEPYVEPDDGISW